MPKNLFVHPDEVKKEGEILFDPIPMNQFREPFSVSRKKYTDKQLIAIYHDMYLIRVFESLLLTVKRDGAYHGIPCRYDGPLHTSLGQEAAAVGQAFCLTADDLVFGSHRSHGEVLAKGLSAIRKSSDGFLDQIMRRPFYRAVARCVENGQTSVADRCTDFFLYGIMAEILAKKTGFQNGLSGSMHAFFLPFGAYPNNAIVGASAPIAVGAALYKKVNGKSGIVVSNVGDGALGRGPVWEAMNFAAMDQYNTLWDDAQKGGLPILFNFFNNFYGMGGQTVGETMAYGHLARIGAGISSSQLYAERVDGSNPFAVIDAMERKMRLMREHKSPVLLDVITYRIAPHSASDHESYRTPEEVRVWSDQDPVAAYRKQLTDHSVLTDGELRDLEHAVEERVERIFRLCADPDRTPVPSVNDEEKIRDYIFSDQHLPRRDERPCQTLLPYAGDPRSLALQKKARGALDSQGRLREAGTYIELRDALFEAIRDKFYEDPTLVAYGEEVRDWGGPYGVYEGLTETLPYHRFFNSPISESAIVASGVGYAMAGGRAIVELPFCDFLGCAGDEIFNQMPKWQFMSAGQLILPLVLRIAVGSLYGTQHAQDFTAMAAHIPGLKVVYPATPYDAKGMMTAALNGSDPVVFFESQDLYATGESFRKDGVPTGCYEIPLGKADVKRIGGDVTILTIGPALYTALAAAEQLKSYGCRAEIIDARSLVPFDYEPLLRSVKKTGRLLLISQEVERGAFIKEIAQTVTELAFDDLKRPPITYGCRNWIAPTGEISKHYFPDPQGVLDRIHQFLFPLNGYTPQKVLFSKEVLQRAAQGR